MKPPSIASAATLLLSILASTGAVHTQSPTTNSRPIQPTLFEVQDILVATRAAWALPENTALEPDKAPESERLARFLRTFAEPSLRADEDIRGLRGGVLVVRAAPARVDWVAEFLNAVRANRSRDLLISQLRIANLPATAHTKLIAPLAPAGVDASAERFSYSIPAGDEATNWGGFLEREPSTELLVSPRVTTHPLMRASISVGETLTYRKDYASTRDDGGLFHDALVEDTVFDGLELELTAASVGSGIAATISFTSSSVTRPFAESEATLASGKRVTIDLPEIRRIEVEQALVLEDGGIAVTSVPQDDGRYLLFCVQIHRQRQAGK